MQVVQGRLPGVPQNRYRGRVAFLKLPITAALRAMIEAGSSQSGWSILPGGRHASRSRVLKLVRDGKTTSRVSESQSVTAVANSTPIPISTRRCSRYHRIATPRYDGKLVWSRCLRRVRRRSAVYGKLRPEPQQQEQVFLSHSGAERSGDFS